MANKQSKQKGFSLVEMMVALVILSVSILALSSMTLMAIRTNTKNELRNAAARISQQTANDLLAKPFIDVIDGVDTHEVPIRGGERTFDTSWVVTNVSDVKQVEIEVEYDFGTATFINHTVIYRSRN